MRIETELCFVRTFFFRVYVAKLKAFKTLMHQFVNVINDKNSMSTFFPPCLV